MQSTTHPPASVPRPAHKGPLEMLAVMALFCLIACSLYGMASMIEYGNDLDRAMLEAESQAMAMSTEEERAGIVLVSSCHSTASAGLPYAADVVLVACLKEAEAQHPGTYAAGMQLKQRVDTARSAATVPAPMIVGWLNKFANWIQ